MFMPVSSIAVAQCQYTKSKKERVEERGDNWHFNFFLGGGGGGA